MSTNAPKQPINSGVNFSGPRPKPSPAPPWMAERKAQINIAVQARIEGVNLPKSLSRQIHEEH